MQTRKHGHSCCIKQNRKKVQYGKITCIYACSYVWYICHDQVPYFDLLNHCPRGCHNAVQSYQPHTDQEEHISSSSSEGRGGRYPLLRLCAHTNFRRQCLGATKCEGFFLFVTSLAFNSNCLFHKLLSCMPSSVFARHILGFFKS